MRILSRLRSCLGLTAVAATVFLSAPGVDSVRADGDQSSTSVELSSQDPAKVAALEDTAPAASEPASPSPRPGLNCSASGPRSCKAGLDAQLAAQLEAIRAARAQQPSSADGDVIVLNGRGYNYGPGPGLEDAQPLRREAERAP